MNHLSSVRVYNRTPSQRDTLFVLEVSPDQNSEGTTQWNSFRVRERLGVKGVDSLPLFLYVEHPNNPQFNLLYYRSFTVIHVSRDFRICNDNNYSITGTVRNPLNNFTC